jgi:8-oxo-dGTP pyrophosphatase MutT (NUDIX family)
MILFCRRATGEWFVPLTLRAPYNGPHSAQISLPGGRFEPDDGNLANTALRECAEEIGLAGAIRIIGSLSPLHISVSRYVVYPFVGVYEGGQPTYRTQEREVSAVIEVPLEELLSETCRTAGIFESSFGEVKAPCFVFGDQQVWGATAMILSELREVIKEARELPLDESS